MYTEQERNKALTLQMVEEVWNKGNLDFADSIIAPSFQEHPPRRFYEVPSRGKESLIMAASAFRNGFSDYHDEKINIVAEGDRVAYLARVSGTHDGKFFDFEPTGKKISVLAINFYRFEDGKIAEYWGLFDTMGMMMQMGIMPGPGGA